MQNFEKLSVYKDAISFVNRIYSLTKNFPREELFGISSQLRRSALSIALNIAEGQGRKTKKDHKQFLFIARGSVNEVIAILTVCSAQNIIGKNEYCFLREKIESLVSQINGLIRYLDK